MEYVSKQFIIAYRRSAALGENSDDNGPATVDRGMLRISEQYIALLVSVLIKAGLIDVSFIV